MNAARDLAATGTPGPWELSKPASGDPWIEQVGLTGNAVLEHEQVDCMSYCYGGSSRYNLSDADASKIVRAVNALPAIADLLDAIDALGDVTPEANQWDVVLIEGAVFAARDAVAAALTGGTMTELSPAEASAIVGDDIEYWLANPFMTPALLAKKAAFWVAAARADGARDMRAKIEALADELTPPLNCELRYDGSTDTHMAAWVEGRHDAVDALRARLADGGEPQ